MNYGERLKKARLHAKLSQAELAERAKVSQANISKLENGDATGSEYTVQLAVACNVCPIWLATGEGDMINYYQTRDKTETLVLQVMQEMDAATKYQLLKISHTLAEPKKDNGTQQ